MKKLVLTFVVLVIGISLCKEKEELLIPKEAIRFRVIANSNDEYDQEVKMLVRDTIQKQMVEDLKESDSIIETRSILKNNTTNYGNLVSNTLSSNQIEEDFNVSYGMNYFPEKSYKWIKYGEGYYESLVVTLGDGLGDNWWCVLFPPLCLLEAEEVEDKTEVEYRFFIKELIDKYF